MRVAYLTISSFSAGKHKYGVLKIVADNGELEEQEEYDVTTEVSRAQAKRLNRDHGRGGNPFRPGDETQRIEKYETVIDEGKKLAREKDLDVLFKGEVTRIYPKEVLIGPDWLRFQHRKAGEEATNRQEANFERWDRVMDHLRQNKQHPELEDTHPPEDRLGRRTRS